MLENAPSILLNSTPRQVAFLTFLATWMGTSGYLWHRARLRYSGGFLTDDRAKYDEEGRRWLRWSYLLNVVGLFVLVLFFRLW